MGFVKVRHKDGRTADITPEEVAFYRSIGFTPVDGQGPLHEGASSGTTAASESVQAPTNGTDQRLDLVLDELRGMRADLARFNQPIDAAELEAIAMPPLEVDFSAVVDEIRGLRADLAQRATPTPEPEDGDTVELRGAGKAKSTGSTTSTTTTPEPTTSTTTTPAPKR